MVPCSHASSHRSGGPDRAAQAHPRCAGLAARHDGRHHAVWRGRSTPTCGPDRAPVEEGGVLVAEAETPVDDDVVFALMDGGRK